MKNLFIILACFAVTVVAAQRTIVMPDGHSLLVKAIVQDKQGKFMYTAESHKCIMWEVKTGKQLYTFKYIGGDNDIHLSVNSKGDRLIIVANNTLMLYNTITGEQLAKTESYPSYSDASFANDDVIIGASNGIRLFDAKTYPNAPISKAILITKQEFGCSKTKSITRQHQRLRHHRSCCSVKTTIIRL